MNTYYYDKEARTLLAVSDNGAVSILEPVNPSRDEHVAAAQVQKFSDAQLFPTRKNKGAGCPECGSISKHKACCSRPAKIDHYPTGARKPIKRGPCAECGSKSTRHKKTCSKSGQKQSLTGNDAWATLDNEDNKRKGLMSERQYGQVKTAHQHGMDPTSIAHEMNLTVKEVNTAVLARSFVEYSE